MNAKSLRLMNPPPLCCLVCWLLGLQAHSNSINSRVANVQYLFASVKSNQINPRCGYQGYYWGTLIGCKNNILT